VTNGHSSDIVSETDRMGKLQTNETDDKTNKLTDRLALPTEENEYDGDESEMSHSQIRRGRRSIKRKPPPKGGVALFGGADLFEGKNPFAHRRGDSEEKEVTHSELCDPSDKESLIDTEAEQKEAARKKKEEDERKLQDERKKLEENERKRKESEELKEKERTRKEAEEIKEKERKRKEAEELKEKERKRKEDEELQRKKARRKRKTTKGRRGTKKATRRIKGEREKKERGR